MIGKRQSIYPIFGMCIFLANASSVQTIYGNANIEDMNISHEMRIMGMGNIKDSVLAKDIRVTGFLTSQNTHYQGNIYTVGSDLSLNQDTVEGDVHITNYIKRPKLHLNNTSIQGKVVFHGKSKGLVYQDPGSEIKQGIENGEVST